MTESKIFADDFNCTFKEPDDFLCFLKERKENSRWMVAPSKSLQFESVEKDSQFGNLYMQLYATSKFAIHGNFPCKKQGRHHRAKASCFYGYSQVRC